MDDFTRITFLAEIKLTTEEINDAGNDFCQAVQNEIGGTGAVVIEVETVSPPTNAR